MIKIYRAEIMEGFEIEGVRLYLLTPDGLMMLRESSVRTEDDAMAWLKKHTKMIRRSHTAKETK